MLTGLVLGFGEIFVLSLLLFLLVGASGMSRYGKTIRETINRFRSSLQGSNPEEDAPSDSNSP